MSGLRFAGKNGSMKPTCCKTKNQGKVIVAGFLFLTFKYFVFPEDKSDIGGVE